MIKATKCTYFFLVTSLFLSLCSCLRAGDIGFLFTEIFGGDFTAVVGEFFGDRTEPACDQFELTEEIVNFFFLNARLIDGYSLEKQYPWYPCGFEGSVTMGDFDFRWSISPGGKGFLESDVFGSIYLICGVGCEDAFPHGGNLFSDDIAAERKRVGDTLSQDTVRYEWYEVWVGQAEGVPHVLILGVHDRNLEVVNPLEESLIVARFSNYDDAREWLSRRYQLVRGRAKPIQLSRPRRPRTK